jgi:chemotaxis protein CheC
MGILNLFNKEKEESVTSPDKTQAGELNNITSLDLDALKETANIGTGNASIALSNIFKKKVNITLPNVELSDSSQISRMVAGPDEMVVGIYSQIMEGMQGNILTLMPIDSALSITRAFLSKDINAKNIDEKDKQLLQKIGTAIYSSYLTSLAKFFEKKVTFAPPSVVSTYGSSIHEFLLLHLGSDEKILVIKLGFDIDKTEIKGDFLLLFTYESLTPLLSNIHLKMNQH